MSILYHHLLKKKGRSLAKVHALKGHNSIYTVLCAVGEKVLLSKLRKRERIVILFCLKELLYLLLSKRRYRRKGVF